jgi:hypothetical protein
MRHLPKADCAGLQKQGEGRRHADRNAGTTALVATLTTIPRIAGTAGESAARAWVSARSKHAGLLA